MRYILLLIVSVFTQLTVKSQSFTPLPDTTYSEMLWIAAGKYKVGDTTFQIVRTSPIYVVVSVTNAATGEEKIICTTYNGLEGAIEFDSGKAKKDYKKGYFAFYSKKSLNNVGFFSYDHSLKDSCLSNVTAKQLQEEWEKDTYKFWNTYSGECQKYYAHLLFNNGILSSQGSLASEFSVVNKDKIKRKILESMKK